MSLTNEQRDRTIASLRRQRPRNLPLRVTCVLFGALVVYSWCCGAFDLSDLIRPARMDNLARFWERLVPDPLRDAPFSFQALGQWLGETLGEGRGLRAVSATLAASVAAIVLAGLAGGFLALLAARSLAQPEPYLPAPRAPGAAARLGWQAVTGATRLLLIFLRAVPEYVWAFLLLALLGLGAWPVVLALALHNAGILGKLFAETIENLDQATPAALRGVGASRMQIAATALFPAALGRCLLYLFYRWETCVREATVLGLLGFVSLGWFIQDHRSRLQYDEMVLYVLLGSALILVGDAASAIARALLRRASV